MKSLEYFPRVWMLHDWLPIREKTAALMLAPIPKLMEAYRLRRSFAFRWPDYYDGKFIKCEVPE